jgi:polyphenol oxidase
LSKTDNPLNTVNRYSAFSLPALGDLNRRSFIVRSRDGLTWLEAPNLVPLPSIVHAFSSRAAGNFRSAGEVSAELSSRSGADVESERRNFLNALRAECFELSSVRQVHSAKVAQVTHSAGTVTYHDSGSPDGQVSRERKPEADALMTADSGVLLAIRTADCLPVLIADPRRGSVAAVHAGWRGALEGVVEKTVREMRRAFNSAPRDLAVALGPSIRACCYVVGPEVVDAFCSRFARGPTFFRSPLKQVPASSGTVAVRVAAAGAQIPADSAYYLDLVAVALDQLERAGVLSSQIDVADFCTSCRTDLFFSYRKEGAATGRMLAVIGRCKT